MKIIVLAGGKSDEHDVSMSSGSKISNALIENGHKVLLIDLLVGVPQCKDFDCAYEKYYQDHYTYEIPKEVSNLRDSKVNEIGENILDICSSADIVFIALHGGIGENGQLQAIFDSFNIRYTGSGYQGSLLAMNKLIAKELMSIHNILSAPWCTVSKNVKNKEIKLPAVIKPTDNGSSIGVAIVENKEELDSAIDKAFDCSSDSKILIEEKITGREFSVGVLGEQVLPVIELKPRTGFYDYQNKYQNNRTEEIVPANISVELSKKMQEISHKVHELLGLSVYSRTDFLLDHQDEIFVIEINSLPGMTPNSLLPQEAKAIGINFNELCERIVEESLKKYQ